MAKKWLISLAAGTALVGAGTVIGSLSDQTSVKAAVKTHKITALPKSFRGTWYIKKTSKKDSLYKIKVTGKKFWISKYRKSNDPHSSSATSEQYFTPYKLSGTGTHKNTIYLLNGDGISTIRRTTVKGKAALIWYDEQQHGSGFAILAKTKHSSIQRNFGGSNPFGMAVTNRKTAKENQRFYETINPSVKKHFGAAVKKRHAGGAKTGIFKGISFHYYTAYHFWEKIVN